MNADVQPEPVRWRNSLIVRVIGLCAILILCLLGSVYVLTVHYYSGLVHEMESRAEKIADEFRVMVEQTPDFDLESGKYPEGVPLLDEKAEVSWTKVDAGGDVMPVSRQISIDGQTVTARVLTETQGAAIMLTMTFPLNPQAEVVRAFKNRYLMALSLGFVAALAVMIYLIAKALRPLRELSQTCAEITEGNLRDVSVQSSTSEVRALEQTFNRMVKSLRNKEVVEANLRQAQRLSAIGNLAAGVAHDVRNPLNAIKLLSSHAMDTLGEAPEAATAVRQLQTIRSEVDRLEDIVSGFLSLAKEEELHRQPVNVDEILDECVRLVKKDAEARQIRFITELRTGDTTLLLDPQRWTRALLNVIINAMEACPPGGRVRLFSRVTDQTCEIEVRDDGPGMTPEQIERAFDAYYTTKPTGTGLGLSITRGVVEEHGGTITLSSSPGSGVQVLIVLPLRPAGLEYAPSGNGRRAEGK